MASCLGSYHRLHMLNTSILCHNGTNYIHHETSQLGQEGITPFYWEVRVEKDDCFLSKLRSSMMNVVGSMIQVGHMIQNTGFGRTWEDLVFKIDTVYLSWRCMRTYWDFHSTSWRPFSRTFFGLDRTSVLDFPNLLNVSSSFVFQIFTSWDLDMKKKAEVFLNHERMRLFK